jgi:hypothetical protein
MVMLRMGEPHLPGRLKSVCRWPRQWARRRLMSALAATKQTLRWLGVIVSGAAVLFATLSYGGFWSYIRGNDILNALADRLDTSYAPDVSRLVKPHDPEWRPLMRVIKRYSRADLLQDREPVVFARAQAIASAVTNAGEWTAPTTPVMLIYREWPAPGTGDFIKGKDFVTVGTLGDIHDWIKRDQADFDFFWRTLIFGLLSFCIGVFLALPDPSKLEQMGASHMSCVLLCADFVAKLFDDFGKP